MEDSKTVRTQDLLRCLEDMRDTAKDVEARLEDLGRGNDALKAGDIAEALDMVRSILGAHFDRVEGVDLIVPPIPIPGPRMPYLPTLCAAPRA